MKKAAIIAIAGLATAASADVLLEIDLSVADTLTITATDGLAAVDSSASNFTGFLLAGFYNTAGVGVSDLSTGGDLSTAGNPSDGTPDIFNGGSSSDLNIWSFSTDSTVGVTMGEIAFSGSSSMTVSSADFAEMLAGNTMGDIIFGADTDDDLGDVIGTWVVIPAPSSLALLGLGGIVAGRRRR